MHWDRSYAWLSCVCLLNACSGAPANSNPSSEPAAPSSDARTASVPSGASRTTTTAGRSSAPASSANAGSAGPAAAQSGGSPGDSTPGAPGANASGPAATSARGAIATTAQPTPSIPAPGTAGPRLSVDLDMSGRPSTEVSELGYQAWPVMKGASSSSSFQGVTFTFAKAGTNGSGVAPTWSKAAVDAPNYARLIGDGITVEDGDKGATITLTISGLPAGDHALATYHNVTTNVQSSAPLDILVDGKPAVSAFQPSIGALSKAEVRSTYIPFKASGSDVVITFQAQATSAAASKNVVINGFELDAPDATKQALDPTPANNDEHVAADGGELMLSWKAAAGASSHDVYFGTDVTALAHADHGSPLFQGNQAAVSFKTQGLSSIQRYYWRIDEVDAQGNITPGEIWYFRPRQLAFPEAEGYGRFAIGGRGGVVVHVTNLDDSGPGSLRDAIETERGPRTIVFDVGGVIALSSRLSVSQSYITVAGQTAPGKGICVRAAPFGLTGVHDVVMRDVRVRLGHGVTFDGMGMQGSDHSIFDHCSISWTIDEAFSSRSAKNITLQRTLISECLNVAGHQNYPQGTEHGYAGTISGDLGSFHHNLLAHCEGRNWSLGGGLDASGNFAGRLDIFNTVVYNWGGRTTDGGAHEVNFVNNYYKPGAASSVFTALNAQYEEFPGKQQYYFAGNVMPGHFGVNDQDRGKTTSGTPKGYNPWVSAPFFESYAARSSAEEAYKNVLSDVGQTQPLLDDHDARVIQETLSGSARYKGSVSGKPGLPDTEADVGGFEDYPQTQREPAWDSDNDGLADFWERARQLDPHSAQGDFSDANIDLDANGFTELDEYLDWMSRPHYFTTTDKPVIVDLSSAFPGYTSSPSFTAPAVDNGTVAIAGAKATFTAAGCGFGGFQLQVQDSAGASMTKRYQVFVSCGASE